MNNLINDYLKIVSAVKSYLEEQVELGFSDWPRDVSNTSDSSIQHPASSLNSQLSTLNSQLSSPTYGTIDEIRLAVANCNACGLHKTRTNVVFGTGNESAKLVFVGEAPGEDEDLQGKPFVGKAGQKLTQIIEAMGLARSDVYITNVLKCRPPGNRNPLPEEIKVCEPYLIAQLRLIKPELICALGTFAAQTLLRSDQRISSLRGRFYTYQGIKLMPTYHPAFLLRNPKFKREVWEDVKKIMAEYNK